MIHSMVPFPVTFNDPSPRFQGLGVIIDAVDVLCAQLTRDLFAIAKFLFKSLLLILSFVLTTVLLMCNDVLIGGDLIITLTYKRYSGLAISCDLVILFDVRYIVQWAFRLDKTRHAFCAVFSCWLQADIRPLDLQYA